jgi:uroporphyrinogen III methyltransferase/synthase
VQRAGLTAPTVAVIGEVVRFRQALATFERRPLFGQRVLILRAADQSAELVVRLAAAGAEPVVVPLLAFAPSSQPDVLRDALARAPVCDWLVFTSANAVRFSLPWLPALRAGERPRIACIGRATAAAAARAGLAVQPLPEGPTGPTALVETLARHGSLEGAEILLPRAAVATADLPEALRARGARVHCVEAYRNIEPPGAGMTLRAAMREQLDAVVFTSPSTVGRLFAILGERELHDLAKRCGLISIGPTTAAALRERGLVAVREAAEASSDGLIAALESYFSEGEHEVS